MSQAMIKRDKRLHELLMLELRYDKKDKVYRGLYPYNSDSVVTMDQVNYTSDEGWNELIDTIPIKED